MPFDEAVLDNPSKIVPQWMCTTLWRNVCFFVLLYPRRDWITRLDELIGNASCFGKCRTIYTNHLTNMCHHGETGGRPDVWTPDHRRPTTDDRRPDTGARPPTTWIICPTPLDRICLAHKTLHILSTMPFLSRRSTNSCKTRRN